MKHTLQFSALAMALAFAAGSSLAQSPGSNGTTTGSSPTGGRSAATAQPGTGTRGGETRKDDKVSRSDRKFIEEAAGSGMFEVQVGQLASSKASDPSVKQFAGMLVDQHQKANDELTKLANAKGVELPAAPPRDMRKKVEDMAKKQGQEFDQAFVREVGIKDHEKDIKAFEKAQKDVKDPELKAFVEKSLPMLKEHLAQAKKLPQAGGKGDEHAAGKGTHAMGAGSAGTGTTPAGGSTRTGGSNGANRTGS